MQVLVWSGVGVVPGNWVLAFIASSVASSETRTTDSTGGAVIRELMISWQELGFQSLALLQAQYRGHLGPFKFVPKVAKRVRNELPRSLDPEGPKSRNGVKTSQNRLFLHLF